MEANTFDDVEKYKMLKYINDKYESLSKSERSVITKYIQNVHMAVNNLASCIFMMGNYKGDWTKQERTFLENTRVLHLKSFYAHADTLLITEPIRSRLKNYTHAKLKTLIIN